MVLVGVVLVGVVLTTGAAGALGTSDDELAGSAELAGGVEPAGAEVLAGGLELFVFTVPAVPPARERAGVGRFARVGAGRLATGGASRLPAEIGSEERPMC